MDFQCPREQSPEQLRIKLQVQDHITKQDSIRKRISHHLSRKKGSEGENLAGLGAGKGWMRSRSRHMLFQALAVTSQISTTGRNRLDISNQDWICSLLGRLGTGTRRPLSANTNIPGPGNYEHRSMMFAGPKVKEKGKKSHILSLALEWRHLQSMRRKALLHQAPEPTCLSLVLPRRKHRRTRKSQGKIINLI